jgi:hypothetical protein
MAVMTASKMVAPSLLKERAVMREFKPNAPQGKRDESKMD